MKAKCSMNDLISRSALLEELSKDTIITDDLYGMGIMAGNDHAMKKIEAAPAVDAVPKWISVKERLPERNKRILVAFKGGMVTTSMCINEASCFLFENDYGKVTHWMPLPEPPKGC